MSKVCSICKEEKSLDDFYKRKLPSGVSTIHSYCKPCVIRKNRENEWKRLYDLEPEQYDKLYSQQKGRCAICEIHQSELDYTLCVDHCHDTGNVRGLLCKKCNQGIGMLQDNFVVVMRAASYLSPSPATDKN